MRNSKNKSLEDGKHMDKFWESRTRRATWSPGAQPGFHGRTPLSQAEHPSSGDGGGVDTMIVSWTTSLGAGRPWYLSLSSQSTKRPFCPAGRLTTDALEKVKQDLNPGGHQGPLWRKDPCPKQEIKSKFTCQISRPSLPHRLLPWLRSHSGC